MSSGMPDPDPGDHPWWGWVLFGLIVAGYVLSIAFLITVIVR